MEYVHKVFNKMFFSYIRRWNEARPLAPKDYRKKGFITKHDYKLYGQAFRIQPSAREVEMQVDAEGDSSVTFSLPIKVESEKIVEKNGLSYLTYHDTLQVRLVVGKQEADATLPEFQLTVRHAMSRAKCAGIEGICATIQKDLNENLHQKVLGFDAKSAAAFFDGPSASRLIRGLLRTFNRHIVGTTTRIFKITQENIYAIINCD